MKKDMNQYRNKHGQVWLNVASSSYVLEDFVNLDNHIFLALGGLVLFARKVLPTKYHARLEEYGNARRQALLIKHDCRKPLFFPNGSVDHVLCSHFLEHIYLAEMQRNISDYYRVLKSGGTLHVIVPDLQAQVQDYLSKKKEQRATAADEFIRETLLSRETRGSLLYRTLEFVGSFGLQHRWMYDHTSMEAAVQNAGFTILRKNTTPSCQYRMNDDSVHVAAFKP